MTKLTMLVQSALAAVCLVALGVSPVVAKDAHVGEISGRARVVDGDTLEISSQKIRLAGMDAPESDQVCRDESEKAYRCGREATEALSRIVAGQSLVCRITGTDRYRRLLAQCAISGTADVGLEMVRLGWATIYDGGPALPGYSAAEASARRQKIGLWRGRFERPSAWRRQHLTGLGGHHA
jgi:endonuclease YncB( thermonuclease family)